MIQSTHPLPSAVDAYAQQIKMEGLPSFLDSVKNSTSAVEGLQAYFYQCLETKADPVEVVKELAEELAESVDLEFFLQKIGVERENLEALLKFELEKKRGGISIGTRIEDLHYASHRLIALLFDTFGLMQFFRPPASFADTQNMAFKLDMYIKKIELIALGILSLIGLGISASSISCFLLGLLLLELLYKSLAPRLEILPGDVKNLTSKYKHGELPEIEYVLGRGALLQKIEDTLILANKPCLLIGPTGVGKTELAKTFAAWQKSGKEVHYLEATKIINDAHGHFGRGKVGQIVDAMGRHVDEFILVIDELHGVTGNAVISELKPLLDRGGAFRRVIGITTLDEYNEQIKKDPAFDRRFEPIHIPSLAKEPTLQVLKKFGRESGVLATAEALDCIWERTKDKVQPHSARDLFDRSCAHLAPPTAATAPIEDPMDPEDLLVKERRAVENAPSVAQEVIDLYERREEGMASIHQAMQAAAQKGDRVALALLTRAVLPAFRTYMMEKGKNMGRDLVLTKEVVEKTLKAAE